MRRLCWGIGACFAAGVTWGFYLSGYCWPVGVTFYRALSARADAPDYEPEVL